MQRARKVAKLVSFAIPAELVCEILRFVDSVATFHCCLLLSKSIHRFIVEEDSKCVSHLTFTIGGHNPDDSPLALPQTNFPYVRRLSVLPKVFDDDFRSILSHLPCLEHLSVSDASNLLVESFDPLQTPLLSFSLSSKWETFVTNALFDRIEIFSSLESLSLEYCASIDQECLRRLPQLKKLYCLAGFSCTWTEETFGTISDTLEKLVFFQTFPGGVSDRKGLFKSFQMLEVLEIESAYNLAPYHLKDLPRSLRRLKVKACDSIPSESLFREAVGEARLDLIEDVEFEPYYEEIMGEMTQRKPKCLIQ